MGCCLGTSRTPKPVPPPPNHHRHHFHAQKPNSLSQINPKSYAEKPETRSPPPPLAVEEESVKEVLSETPITKPQHPETPPEKVTLSPPKEVPKPAEDQPKMQAEPAVSEASQLSEACGVSESYSYSTTTTATTIADAREDEVTSNRKRDLGPRANGSSGPVRRKRPYSGEVGGQRERGPKPPRRTPEPAVGKRNRTETASSFRGRESGQLRNMQRSGAVPTGVRRETVSSRSRSPATRSGGGVSRAGRGKSPAKVTGRAGGSSSSVSVEESEKKGNYKESKEEVLAGKEEVIEEQSNDGVSQQPQQEGKESLDNPLVSLECFIFV